MASEICILGINGSPHREGIVAELLQLVVAGAAKAGASTRVIHLAELNMQPSPGRYSVQPTDEVPTNMPEDELTALYGEIQRADGLVLATPVYWANMSGLMKTFIDRLTPLENAGPGLKGKIAACIAASKENEGGRETAAMAMVTALLQMGVLVPPRAVLWYPGGWRTVEHATDCWAKEDAPEVGRSMVELARLLKCYPIAWAR